jgi:hypothetical protein
MIATTLETNIFSDCIINHFFLLCVIFVIFIFLNYLENPQQCAGWYYLICEVIDYSIISYSNFFLMYIVDIHS